MDFKIADVSIHPQEENSKDKVYDIIIIGGGPGGLTAALYCSRYKLDTLVIEKEILSGGQMMTTEWVENYPGFEEPILGNTLARAMEKQAKKYGTNFIHKTVTNVILSGAIKEVHTDSSVFRTKTLIISTGASPKKLNIKGENEYRGRGVSYCATCDGPFYPEKILAVIGGGNTALEESLFLAKYAQKIYIIHRSDTYRADGIIQDRVRNENKIESVFNSELKEIKFDDASNKHIIISTRGEQRQMNVDGVFIFIGMIPNTRLFSSTTLQMDDTGYIKTDEEMKTNINGVYAVGDVRAKSLRQIATSVGDGAIAAHSVNIFLSQDA